MLLSILAALAAEPVPAAELHTLWNYGEPAATAEKFVEQIALAKAADDTDAELQYRTQLARTHSLRGAFDEAHAILDAVEAELKDPSSVLKARYHLERGRAYRSAKVPTKALPQFHRAFTAASSAKNVYLTVDAAHMLAVTEGPMQQAWHDRALDLARDTEDERARGWLGSLLNNKAWAVHDGGDFEGALPIFEEALAFFESQGKEQPIGVARYSVGRCLRSLGRVDEAWAIQHALIESNDGYVFEELGELELLKGGDAQPWFAKAWPLLSEDRWLVEQEPERVARIKELAAVKP